MLFFDVAASFDSAVHQVHAVSFDAAVASPVSAACIVAAGYTVTLYLLIFISADGIKSFLLIMFLLVMFSFMLTEIESADLIYRRD
ncbi:hypothetical protein Tco_0585386 [Tanacetum coccineum]